MKTIKRFFAWLKQLGEICAPLAVADSHPWNCCCPICCELGFGYEPSRRQTQSNDRQPECPDCCNDLLRCRCQPGE